MTNTAAAAHTHFYVLVADRMTDAGEVTGDTEACLLCGDTRPAR